MSTRIPAPLPISTRASVLLVEDDECIREAVSLLLEDAGYAVTAMSNVEDAQNHLSVASCAHVVLLDFLLPPGSADTLLQAIDQDAALGRHRYVLIPASDVTLFSAEAQRLIAAQCTQIVYKPFDVDHLLAVVEQTAAQLPPHPCQANDPTRLWLMADDW